jgi:hypothetical protein
MSKALLLSYFTRAVADAVHQVDLAIADRAFMADQSMSDFNLRRAEDTLRELADRIAGQRHRLLCEQPGFQFLQAAE